MPPPDPNVLTSVSNAFPALQSAVWLCGTLVSFGMIIQRLFTLGERLKELRHDFDEHRDDRNIHPDTARVAALEARK